MFEVTLPITGDTVNVLALVVLGVAAGLVAGFFGVGGGVLIVPLLHIVFGVDYNFAVGSSLAVIFGTSIAATIRHHKLQQVDFRLGGLLVVSATVAAWLGTAVVEALKGLGTIDIGESRVLAVNFVLPLAYAVLLVLLGILFLRESVQRKRQLRADPDAPFVAPLSATMRRALGPPRIALPASGIEQVSVWVLLLIGLASGFLAGLLGIGGGIVAVPAMIYLLGAPTAVAVGTSLFMIVFASATGTVAHAVNGNCDVVLAACLLVGSAAGAHGGATVTKRLRGVQIRYAFAYLAFAMCVLVLLKVALTIGLF